MFRVIQLFIFVFVFGRIVRNHYSVVRYIPIKPPEVYRQAYMYS